MKTFAVIAPLAALALCSCAVPVGPVEVARFHLPDTAALGHGTVAVAPGPGMDGASLEIQTYQTAIEAQLAKLGYTPAPPDQADQIAQIRIARSVVEAAEDRTRLGVSAVGSNRASAIGLGVSIPLGRASAQRSATDLAVVIRDRASGKVLWEGRASFSVAATSPLAQSGLAAPKLAQALFANFPGVSGQSVVVP